MNFLKSNRLFSFLYSGKPIDACNCKISQEIDGSTLKTVYLFPDGLKVTNTAKKYEDFGAYEWVNQFENTSNQPSQIISELNDGDFTVPFEYEAPPKFGPYINDIKKATKIYAPSGSTWSSDEFFCDVDKICNNNRINHITPGQTKKYSTSGGRSSEEHAPFFNISKNGKGMIFAIGWSGQWNCEITREEAAVKIKAGIENTAFRLKAGEKIRTSSLLIMPYDCGLNNSQNRWRRLIKENFSLIGKEGRLSSGPLCCSIWGGKKTESILKRIAVIKKERLPFEYIWIDAGWYGENTEPTPDEFEGDWPQHTGDWVVSKRIHPGGLIDVSKAIHDAGMKFILWFEPERVIDCAPIVKLHPEYFIRRNDTDSNLLLNLGREDAWNYCYKTLAEIIRTLNVDVYRQDFNFAPLEFWRKLDSEGEKGICEIRHINGLYRLWDALLAEFPNLAIDNCASGGRRIDIETLRRSIPLWRSDYMCPANFDASTAQSHSLNFNTWLPYSGTGTGRVFDKYHVRSTYSFALTTNYAFSEHDSFFFDADKINFIKNFTEEYIKIRPYFSEDFYPLTEYSDKEDVWCAMQFDRPSENDGVVLLFRRDKSPYCTAVFTPGNICEKSLYKFIDADTDECLIITGKELKEKGFTVSINEPHASKIYFYSVI